MQLERTIDAMQTAWQDAATKWLAQQTTPQLEQWQQRLQHLQYEVTFLGSRLQQHRGDVCEQLSNLDIRLQAAEHCA